MAQTEHFRSIPSDYAANIVYRDDLRIRCELDRGFRREIMEVCKEDVLFWLSAFCWLFEPRRRYFSDGTRKPNKVPFIPWPHQVQLIDDLRALLGVEDAGVEKSRGEGLS